MNRQQNVRVKKVHKEKDVESGKLALEIRLRSRPRKAGDEEY